MRLTPCIPPEFDVKNFMYFPQLGTNSILVSLAIYSPPGLCLSLQLSQLRKRWEKINSNLFSCERRDPINILVNVILDQIQL